MDMDVAEYRRLIDDFPPTPIHDRKQLDATESIISELLALRELSPAHDAYLELLSMVVATWEDENVRIPELTGRELLEVLIEERGLRQKDLAPIFGTESIVSEILSGRRRMNVRHVTRLAEFFHVSPGVFIRMGFPEAELVLA